MDKQQLIEQLKSYFGIDTLSKELQIYINCQIEIFKTSVVENSSKAIYNLIKLVGLLVLGLCFFLFLNLMLAFGISEWFFEGKYWTGFGCMAGFYLLLLLMFLLIQPMIRQKVEDGILEQTKGTPLELKPLDEVRSYTSLNKNSHTEKETTEKPRIEEHTSSTTSTSPEQTT